MWLILVAVIQVLHGPLGTSATESPCPDVFRYEGSPGSEYGIITVPNPYPYVAIEISVSIYITAPVPSSGRTKLEPVDGDMWRKLADGSRDPVLYRLVFPVSSPLPTIRSITVNKNVICTGSKPNASYLTTITVQHAIFDDRCNSASLDCPANTRTSSDVWSPPRPQPPPANSGDGTVPPSPCPGVFEYKSDGSGDSYGLISVPNPYPLVAIDIKVELYAATYTATRRGSLRLVNDLGSEWNRMRTGEQYFVQYRLDFPVRSPLPTINSIVVNNRQICSGRKPDSPGIGTFSFQHGLFCSECTSASPDCPCNVVRDGPTPGPPPVTPTPAPAPPPPPPPPPPPSTSTRCGLADVLSNPLIVLGQGTIPAEWPWHAALYLHQGFDNKYRCGGSVIGIKTIITAAHCVTNSNGKAMAADSFLVALGRYDLTIRKEEGTQEFDVQRLLPHPAYNHRTFDADIALITLNTSIQYTRSVKPVCLWNPTDTRFENIIGEKGVVVGWGRDENGFIAQVLKKVVMPVVSRETCKKKQEQFFLTFVHTNNFCAGYANGSSPCNGDSGSAIVIPTGKEENRIIWSLRGMVSNTRPGEIETICDPKSFVVFTDVAQYLDWIKPNLF